MPLMQHPPQKNLLLIEQKAQEFVKSQGYNYTVKAE